VELHSTLDNSFGNAVWSTNPVTMKPFCRVFANENMISMSTSRIKQNSNDVGTTKAQISYRVIEDALDINILCGFVDLFEVVYSR
jgi:hypothetical protein